MEESEGRRERGREGKEGEGGGEGREERRERGKGGGEEGSKRCTYLFQSSCSSTLHGSNKLLVTEATVHWVGERERVQYLTV